MMSGSCIRIWVNEGQMQQKWWRARLLGKLLPHDPCNWIINVSITQIGNAIKSKGKKLHSTIFFCVQPLREIGYSYTHTHQNRKVFILFYLWGLLHGWLLYSTVWDSLRCCCCCSYTRYNTATEENTQERKPDRNWTVYEQKFFFGSCAVVY